MVALKCDGLKMRHWTELFDLVKQPIVVDISLEKAVEIGFLEELSKCEEITERANKEYLIEIKLLNLQEKWMSRKLKFENYMVKDIDEI